MRGRRRRGTGLPATTIGTSSMSTTCYSRVHTSSEAFCRRRLVRLLRTCIPRAARAYAVGYYYDVCVCVMSDGEKRTRITILFGITLLLLMLYFRISTHCAVMNPLLLISRRRARVLRSRKPPPQPPVPKRVARVVVARWTRRGDNPTTTGTRWLKTILRFKPIFDRLRLNVTLYSTLSTPFKLHVVLNYNSEHVNIFCCLLRPR